MTSPAASPSSVPHVVADKAPQSPYLTFLENPHQLEVIDQRKLPLQEVKVRLRTVDDVKKAIEVMIVRGAPVSIALGRESGTNPELTNNTVNWYLRCVWHGSCWRNQ